MNILNDLRKYRMFRHILARPRLVICVLAGLAVSLLLPMGWHVSTRILVGWNLGCWSFLALMVRMMLNSGPELMRRQVITTDESEFVILFLTIIAVVSSMAAIFAQLVNVKDVHGILKILHISLVFGTVVSAWLFIHFMFALHYAHEFFIRRDYVGRDTLESSGGLRFPGAPHPEFGEFLYFSFVIAAATATADVEIWSKSIRRLATLHTIIAYFFNAAIIGLMINILAGLT